MTDDDDRCDHAWGECFTECECGRGRYCSNEHASCYPCYRDRLADYITCVYCGRWHSPEFDTCFQCRPQGRDEAAAELKQVILARDSFQCRYCGAREGDTQTDPRLIRPKCPPRCVTQHNHRHPCEPGCGKRHRCREAGDPGTCRPGCTAEHNHRVKDDDGVRPVRLHIDHIRPCRHGGTADPWNLQALCGVCNIAKGADWWRGSRHHQARRHMMAAYMTYLNGYLTEDQQEDLAVDAEHDEFGELTAQDAAALIVEDYARRVRAHHPAPVTPHRCNGCGSHAARQHGCTPRGWCRCLCADCAGTSAGIAS